MLVGNKKKGTERKGKRWEKERKHFMEEKGWRLKAIEKLRERRQLSKEILWETE